MGFYENCMLPYLVNLAMRNRRLIPYRERAISAAEGRVLEIGIGSGLNLPFYGATVGHVVGLDPSPRLLAMAQEGSRHSAIPIELVESGAEVIPLHDRSFDTVVTTWTLCSIPDASRALSEMRRVLKPGGRLLFVEHGRAPNRIVLRWQDRLTPIWKRLMGGCHLNREIAKLIEGAGFRLERLASGYMNSRNPMAFMYEGSARPR